MKYHFIKLKEPVGPSMKKTFVPPMGLFQLRSYLKTKGHSVSILDNHLEVCFGQDPQKDDADIIGISAQFSTQHDILVNAVENIRYAYKGKKKIIIGGFHAQFSGITGEDITIVPASGPEYFGANKPYLMHDITEKELSKYWNSGAPHDLQSKTNKWIPFETSRGCNYKCGFCGIKHTVGSHIVSYDIEERLDYIMSIGVEELFIEDDNFILDEITFSKTLSSIKNRGLVWSTPNGIQAKPLYKHLAKGYELPGCWRVSLPFETGCKETAIKMGTRFKYMPFKEAEQLIKMLSDMNIQSCGFFLIGWPGESLKDMQETLDYANALKLNQRNIYIATPYPGTHLYEYCKGLGYLRYTGKDLYSKLQYTECIIDTPDWRAEEVNDLRKADREKAIHSKQR